MALYEATKAEEIGKYTISKGDKYVVVCNPRIDGKPYYYAVYIAEPDTDKITENDGAGVVVVPAKLTFEAVINKNELDRLISNGTFIAQ